MLVIRQQQMEALGRIALASFESELAAHFARFYPRECERAGEEQVLALVQMGIERAAAHGFRNRREAGLYVNLMISLGCDFDRDPQFPWAAQQLDDPAMPNSLARINRLHRATVDFLRQIGGNNQGHLVRALLRMRDYDLDSAPRPGPSLEDELCALMARFYPEKAAFQGADTVRALARCAVARAAAMGLGNGAGATVVAALMFTLGSGFDHDPMYPWAGRALEPANQRSAPETALYRAAMDYLAQALRDS